MNGNAQAQEKKRFEVGMIYEARYLHGFSGNILNTKKLKVVKRNDRTKRVTFEVIEGNFAGKKIVRAVENDWSNTAEHVIDLKFSEYIKGYVVNSKWEVA